MRLNLLQGAIACNLLLLASGPARAQQPTQVAYSSTAAAPDATNLPDAPVPSASSSAPDDPQNTSGGAAADGSGSGKQTKRILGIVPNFRSVSADQKLPPQSVKDKFKTTLQDNFDYSSFIFVGALAGVAMAENSYPQFHQGRPAMDATTGTHSQTRPAKIPLWNSCCRLPSTRIPATTRWVTAAS